MKKVLVRLLSLICAFSLVFSVTQVCAYAEDGKFVNLSVSGYDDSGKEVTYDNNVFYAKGNELYAPISILEKYTMYDYDSKNNSFVRTGQIFKKATSKVVMDYAKNEITVFYSSVHKEIYEINILAFGDTYFFPLDKIAAYLKASVVYKDQDTISIVSSGISICDALYDFVIYNSALSYVDIVDDLFAGSDALYKQYAILGYFGNTVFSFKVSNLFGTWGDYEKYCSIMSNAVTNTSIYDGVINNESTLSDLIKCTEGLYNNVYKKADKIYSLSSNSVTTMFNEYKELNSFGDESPYDNFFPEEQLEIDKINAVGKKIKTVSQFLEIAEYLHEFYTINDDNRDALNTVFKEAENDNRGLAIKKIKSKYGGSLVESGFSKIAEEVSKECAKEIAKQTVSSVLSKINKVKLATTIMNSVFKTFGFDLSDNSSYEVLMAQELVSYMINNCSALDTLKYNTKSESENMRLTAIMVLLVDIEGYELGNKVAKRIDSSDENHYKDKIDEYKNRLALLYLAKNSSNYDSVEATENIIKQNNKEIGKFDFAKLNSLSESDALEMLRYTDDISLMNQQLTNMKTYKDENGKILGYCSRNGYTYRIVDDKESIKTEKFVSLDGETFDASHSGCIQKENETSGEKEIIINDYDGQIVVTDDYIYYYSNRYKQGDYYNDCFDGVDYVRTDLNGKNREILYHDEYTPFGAGIGGPPSFLVTNEYLYISKYNIVKVDLSSKKAETVCDVDINELTGSDWIDLNFVYEDTYYFSLTDNEQSQSENNNVPDICYGYFKYNEKMGLNYIYEVNYDLNGDNFWIDNGDGTRTLKYNYNYIIKKVGNKTEKYAGSELPEKYSFSYNEDNPFSNTGICFVQGDGSKYFYSFDDGELKLQK